MYDRNLGSDVWCGTGLILIAEEKRQARPRCRICNERMLQVFFGKRMLPVFFGNQARLGRPGTAWIWGGHSPKPDSPHWCCSECGVSYMVGKRDSLKFPTVDELPEHIRVSEQGEL